MRKLIPCRNWLEAVMPEPSFAVMRTLLIAAMGEELTPEEAPTFATLTQRTSPAGKAVDELWLIAGRRSGKTKAIATLAAWLAGLCDWRSVLSHGERGVLPILAASMQAGATVLWLHPQPLRGHPAA